MGNRIWREQTIHQLGRAGVTLDDARAALRQSATLQRLAEAECNGDWPAGHGDAWPTAECSDCGNAWHPSALKRGKRCPECRTRDKAKALATECGAEAITAGDPRGAVLSWRVPAIGPGERVVAICG